MSNKGSATLNRAAAKAFRRVPKELIKTLTVDNGKERGINEHPGR
jgi:IS30 family transposase